MLKEKLEVRQRKTESSRTLRSHHSQNGLGWRSITDGFHTPEIYIASCDTMKTSQRRGSFPFVLIPIFIKFGLLKIFSMLFLMAFPIRIIFNVILDRSYHKCKPDLDKSVPLLLVMCLCLGQIDVKHPHIFIPVSYREPGPLKKWTHFGLLTELSGWKCR